MPPLSHDVNPAAADDGQWEDAPDEVPVLDVADHSPSKIILPERRAIGGETAAKPEEGLRIESRITPRSEDPERPAAVRKIEVSEIGKSIVRLESEPTPAAIARQDVLPVMQKRERPATAVAQAATEWDGHKGDHSHKWMLWAGAGVVVAIIAGLAIQPLLTRMNTQDSAKGTPKFELVNDVINPDDPAVYFSQNPGEIVREMRSALTGYARARTVAEVLPFVRDPDHVKESLTNHWQSWNAPADWEPGNDDTPYFTSVGKRPYGAMSGTKPDFSPYNVCLVREGDRMVVDWEATAGYNPVTFSKVADGSVKQLVARVLLSPANFYTTAFPEDRYRAYRLRESGSDEMVWAYAEIGSAAANTLDQIFRNGPILTAEAGEQRMRVRLEAIDGDAPRQWLLRDVLHKGWVTP